MESELQKNERACEQQASTSQSQLESLPEADNEGNHNWLSYFDCDAIFDVTCESVSHYNSTKAEKDSDSDFDDALTFDDAEDAETSMTRSCWDRSIEGVEKRLEDFDQSLEGDDFVATKISMMEIGNVNVNSEGMSLEVGDEDKVINTEIISSNVNQRVNQIVEGEDSNNLREVEKETEGHKTLYVEEITHSINDDGRHSTLNKTKSSNDVIGQDIGNKDRKDFNASEKGLDQEKLKPEETNAFISGSTDKIVPDSGSRSLDLISISESVEDKNRRDLEDTEKEIGVQQTRDTEELNTTFNNDKGSSLSDREKIEDGNKKHLNEKEIQNQQLVETAKLINPVDNNKNNSLSDNENVSSNIVIDQKEEEENRKELNQIGKEMQDQKTPEAKELINTVNDDKDKNLSNSELLSSNIVISQRTEGENKKDSDGTGKEIQDPKTFETEKQSNLANNDKQIVRVLRDEDIFIFSSDSEDEENKLIYSTPNTSISDYIKFRDSIKEPKFEAKFDQSLTITLNTRVGGTATLEEIEITEDDQTSIANQKEDTTENTVEECKLMELNSPEDYLEKLAEITEQSHPRTEEEVRETLKKIAEGKAEIESRKEEALKDLSVEFDQVEKLVAEQKAFEMSSSSDAELAKSEGSESDESLDETKRETFAFEMPLTKDQVTESFKIKTMQKDHEDEEKRRTELLQECLQVIPKEQEREEPTVDSSQNEMAHKPEINLEEEKDNVIRIFTSISSELAEERVESDVTIGETEIPKDDGIEQETIGASNSVAIVASSIVDDIMNDTEDSLFWELSKQPERTYIKGKVYDVDEKKCSVRYK